MTDPHYELYISTKKLTLWLTSIMVVLLAVHVTLQVWHYQWHEVPWLLRQIFDLDEEDSLPTWYSASTLLLASILLFLIGRHKRASGDP